MAKLNKITNQKKGKAKATIVTKEKNHWRYWLMAILAMTFIAYFPSLNNEFLNYDDNLFITENPQIQNLSWENISILFSEIFHSQYGPMAMSIMALEFHFLGDDPWPYKLISILWHVGNTALVFWFIHLLVRKWEVALIAAALFGLHAIQVESVAWLSGSMKIGTYTFFFLTALISYIKYQKTKSNRLYFLSLLFFLFSCFSKEQAITLSVVLLTIDYLLGRNLFSKKVILEKIPFFLISIIFAIISINAIPENLKADYIFNYTFLEKTLFAFYGIGQYIIHSLLPVKLSPYYTFPVQGALPFLFYLLPLVSIFLIWGFSRTYKKHAVIAFGLLFFGINIFLSFATQLTATRDVIMADRYMYVASIGFFLCIGYAYDWIKINRTELKRWAQFGLGAYIMLLALLTFNQNKVWHNSVSLFSDIIDKEEYEGPNKNPFLAPAYNNLGTAQKKQKNFTEALNNFNQAISSNPKYHKAWINRGILYLDQQKNDLALEDLNKGITLSPNYDKGYFNRAAIYLKSGKFDLALKDYDQSIALNPNLPQAYYLRGFAKHSLRKYEEALRDYNQAIGLNTNNGNFYLYRAYTLDNLNRKQEAYQDMLNAQRLGAKVDANYLQRLKRQ